jgi:hypothetical protein
MIRYQLAAQTQASAGGFTVSVQKPDMKTVLAEGDPLLTSTYATLLLDAARGLAGPFTASQVLEKMGAVKIQPSPSLPTVEAALSKLQGLGVVTVEVLN